MTEPSPKPRPRLRLVLAIALVVVASAAVALYAARRTIAEQALVGWLKARGIASEATIRELGLGRAQATLRVGDPRAPDFEARDAEVLYGWRGLSPEVRAVTLKRPVLRARLRAGKLSVGALDPLIQEFLERPPRPDAAKPKVLVDDAVLLLATDYGPMRLTADALVEDGKLSMLDAASDAARLAGGGLSADLGRATLSVKRTGGRASVVLAASGSLRQADLRAEGLRLQLTADVPYPDLVKRRGDGAVRVTQTLSATRIRTGERAVEGVSSSASFIGAAAGWIDDLDVAGSMSLRALARRTDLGAASAGALALTSELKEVRWTRDGGDAVRSTLEFEAQARDVEAADASSPLTVIRGRGALSAGRAGLRATLVASASGRGRWDGFGAPVATDSAQAAAVKRALRSFSFEAQGVSAQLGPSSGFHLSQPLIVRPDRGGEARIAPTGRDSARVLVSGGGLPAIAADVTRVRLTDAGASANLALKTTISIGPAQDAAIDIAGAARLASGRLTFTAARCADVAVPHLEFGDRDIEAVALKLCGAGLTAGAAGWQVTGRAEGAEAQAPWMQARLTGGAGPVVLGWAGGRLSANASVLAGQIADTAPEARFNPLVLTGLARLARDVWTADLSLARAGATIATVKLSHDVPAASGRVDIATGTLRFAEGGLQPADLSPLAEALGEPATGEAAFTGAFAWAGESATSSGVLSIPRLDFQSPAGAVRGLRGEVVLTSLTPLAAAPGQLLRADGLDALIPVVDLRATLSIKDEVLTITGGEAAVGGGRVRIETLQLPLTPGAPTEGVLVFEAVQLKDLVEASPFRDFMDLDARVSGRIPFAWTAGKVRITSGDLKAIEKGRLSINRQLFTGAAGATAQVQTAEPDPNETFRDLAYQAMEHLAFDELAVTLNSQSDGRMGALFHVVGRHDPPQKQRIRISVMDLIRKRFLGRPLPLPSGTRVNLTLDTTMNLDQLLADYAELQKARGQ